MARSTVLRVFESKTLQPPPLFVRTLPTRVTTASIPRNRYTCPGGNRNVSMDAPARRALDEVAQNLSRLHQHAKDLASPQPAATKLSEPALRVVRRHPDATLPVRGSHGAAGYDLSASENGVVPAGGKAIIPTGLTVGIPEGCYARIAPRSGLAAKKSIDVGAGVVDYDYRGEVKVILFNFGTEDFEISQGDRIAQLVLERIMTPDVIEVTSLDSTDRGESGFGSTGKRKLAE